MEFTWNHTTLHALKVDKSLTYLQSSFVPGRHVEQITADGGACSAARC